MKRFLEITLNDDRVIKRDITDATQRLPIGTKAHDSAYVQTCEDLCIRGLNDGDATDDNRLTWIPPSQIKKITVRFDRDFKDRVSDLRKA